MIDTLNLQIHRTKSHTFQRPNCKTTIDHVITTKNTPVAYVEVSEPLKYQLNNCPYPDHLPVMVYINIEHNSYSVSDYKKYNWDKVETKEWVQIEIQMTKT